MFSEFAQMHGLLFLLMLRLEIKVLHKEHLGIAGDSSQISPLLKDKWQWQS